MRQTPSPRDGETEELLPEREVLFPPTVHGTHRRPLGLGPAPLLGGLAAVTFVVALVLLALASWVPGIVFLALSAVAASLFVVAVRNDPDGQSARMVTGAADRADSMGRLIAIWVRAWSRTGVELLRIWNRRRRLRALFKRQLTPLGEAVYRDDRVRAEQLRAEARQLDEALREADRHASQRLAAAREQIERERLPRQPTQRLPVAKIPSSSEP